ncbi:MAG: glucosaminidase domain-containing protein [Flavobacteriales bacterium]|nr:glucosaminidase domain-containing protein [Flavobacteriales bacterium]MCB9190743.1 glucosaminidase domain-containing protein [Flavobacteriales bacterium]
MRSFLSYILIGLQLVASAQSSTRTEPFTKLTRSDYIEKYAPFAVKEMLLSGVPASITLAQGILESGDGNSLLAREANNHFGIKCHGMWEGKKYYMDDDAKNECFRVYASVFDSYKDHSEFLSTRDRYASLFELRRTDYKGWAHGLKKAGYATNPKYPALLIKIIEENDLAKYDRMKTPPKGSIETPEPTVPTKPNPTAETSSGQRQMYLRNNTRYVWVQEGDTYKKLERMLQLREQQLQKYNDLARGANLIPGERLYVQPKRNNNTEQDYHVVAKGETLRWISQEYAVKLKKLYQYNELSIGEEPAIGQKVWLRKKKRSDY